MAEAYELSIAEFELFKLLFKIEEHDKFGMHLKYRTWEEISIDPLFNNYDIDFLYRSTRFTKGKFATESIEGKRYLTISSRYFKPRKNIATHRLLYMLYNNKRLPKSILINHIDGNTFNNIISNLEEVSFRENSTTIYKQKVSSYCTETADGGYKISFKHKGATYCFGTTSNFELINIISPIFLEFKKTYDNDSLLIDFIEWSKYKSLEDRWILLNNPRSAAELNDNLILATKSNIKQSGVRESNNKFRVSIRVNSKSIDFGSYDLLDDANTVAIRVRELKSTNIDTLLSIISSKPKTLIGSQYYFNSLFKEH